MKLFFYIIFVISFLKDYAECWRPFEFYFEKCECWKESESVTFINCSLFELPKQQMGLYFSFEIGKELRKPKLDFLLLNTRPNHKNFVLANFTDIDGCRFLESREILNVIKILRKLFDKYSNMPKKCPIAENTKIEIKDLIMDPNDFPPYVPETEFIVKMRIYESLMPIFGINVYGVTRNRRLRTSMTKKIKKN